MPQSLSNVVLHIVFSTKHRKPMLAAHIRPALFAYIATVARSMQCECLRVGGVADHVHIAVRLSRTITIAELVEAMKTSSSKWLKTLSPELAHFSWQRGYGAFSVNPYELGNLLRYIDRQEEHHRKQLYVDEYRGLLKKHNAEYDERYVWD